MQRERWRFPCHPEWLASSSLREFVKINKYCTDYIAKNENVYCVCVIANNEVEAEAVSKSEYSYINNVIKGNAEYIEIIHIGKEDTIKIYHFQTKK